MVKLTTVSLTAHNINNNDNNKTYYFFFIDNNIIIVIILIIVRQQNVQLTFNIIPVRYWLLIYYYASRTDRSLRIVFINSLIILCIYLSDTFDFLNFIVIQIKLQDIHEHS